jgi:hypothetical protein
LNECVDSNDLQLKFKTYPDSIVQIGSGKVQVENKFDSKEYSFELSYHEGMRYVEVTSVNTDTEKVEVIIEVRPTLNLTAQDMFELL